MPIATRREYPKYKDVQQQSGRAEFGADAVASAIIALSNDYTGLEGRMGREIIGKKGLG